MSDFFDRLEALEESWERLDENADLPTRIPPAPDTFRARLSGLLVEVLHRLFFAQAHQVTEWNRLLLAHLHEQADLGQQQFDQLFLEREEELREVAAANSRLRKETERVDRLVADVNAAREALRELAAENRRLRMWVSSHSLPADALLEPAHEASLPALYPGVRNSDDEARWLDADRLSSYLPFLQEEGAWRSPVLDLGSGSGIWLSLLQREGIPARGIEPDHDLYERALQRGVPISEGGLLAFLREQPAESAGAITSFHTLDGLPFSLLSLLLDEIRRVLQPGAPFLWEVRNRDSLLATGAAYHREGHPKPVAYERVRFWGESHGLPLERGLFLHRAEDEGTTELTPAYPEAFGVQFYGLIFRKPLTAPAASLPQAQRLPETILTR